VKRPSWQWVMISLCLCYTTGLLGFLGLRSLGYGNHPTMVLLSAFQPFLFAPILITVPLALLSRSKTALAGGILASVFFAYYYGACFLPREHSPASGITESIQVMTFNVGLGKASPAQIVSAIQNERADIIAVEEITLPTAQTVQAMLSEQYTYAILAPGAETIGLFSRYPIRQSQWLQPAGSGRALLRARIDWDGHPLDVYAVHPLPAGITWFGNTLLPTGLSFADSQRTIMDIAERLTTLEETTVVAGDFNLGEQTAAYAMLRNHLADAYREAGPGFGFTFPVNLRVAGVPVPGPFVRIDYVFHSPDLVARQAATGCASGSDHCYLVAHLVRKP
jgi:vancomycin resistance protein VanJ